jgi:hypothetical protein
MKSGPCHCDRAARYVLGQDRSAVPWYPRVSSGARRSGNHGNRYYRELGAARYRFGMRGWARGRHQVRCAARKVYSTSCASPFTTRSSIHGTNLRRCAACLMAPGFGPLRGRALGERWSLCQHFKRRGIHRGSPVFVLGVTHLVRLSKWSEMALRQL